MGALPSGGSPGHQTVTGRSWISSGATSADRWRPVSPPAVRKICSEHVSGASTRGSTHSAWIRASSHGGPSGSADITISVRDGWRPVSREMISAVRSPVSGWRATTTRFITDVRAAMWRPGVPVLGRRDQVRLRPDAGQLLLDVVDGVGVRQPAHRGLAGLRRVRQLDPPAAGRPRPDGDDLAERPPGALAHRGALVRQRRQPGVRDRSAAPAAGAVPRSSAVTRSDPPPAPAFAGEQVVGRLGAPRAGVVVGERPAAASRPRPR